MPFPAARYTLSHVDTAGGQRSGAGPCLYPQIYRLLPRGQSAQWKVHTRYLTHIQCRHIRDVSEEIAAASFSPEKDGGNTRQCPVSPRQIAQAAADQASPAPRVIVSAAVQPATGPYRASMEIGTSIGDTQPVLPQPKRSSNCHRVLFRPMAKTKCCANKIMRYYLRRRV